MISVLDLLVALATLLASAPPDVRIRDLEARLFCYQTATFSDDIIGDNPPALWNTIIGAGGGGCKSYETLVLAVIDGPKNAYLGDVRVALTASYAPSRAGGRTVVVGDTLRLGIPGANGVVYVPLWLPRTGCATVELRATLLGGAHPSVRNETIPFECGE